MSLDRTVQEYLVRIHSHRKGLLREDDLAIACIQHHFTHSENHFCNFCNYSCYHWLHHCVLVDASHTKEIAKYLQKMSQAQVPYLFFRVTHPSWHIALLRYYARFKMWSMLRQSLRHLASLGRK
jgi:hypothetical protein